ncbi:unnamed protein product [Vitrella brassicaformis CCMP3155]|uniref:Uncharacterized protein n=2 Tax=Vitrella brassicaformis TaxID=1169539 RepID=A0A0G4G309_VITBC|nr:unnamed protein product [Vitrella brassicaformis CCMP3155]|eukprot:CEM22480.1 unnamed protein product [Vitrella brassicaformis CCMP3155]
MMVDARSHALPPSARGVSKGSRRHAPLHAHSFAEMPSFKLALERHASCDSTCEATNCFRQSLLQALQERLPLPTATVSMPAVSEGDKGQWLGGVGVGVGVGGGTGTPPKMVQRNLVSYLSRHSDAGHTPRRAISALDYITPHRSLSLLMYESDSDEDEKKKTTTTGTTEGDLRFQPIREEDSPVKSEADGDLQVPLLPCQSSTANASTGSGDAGSPRVLSPSLSPSAEGLGGDSAATSPPYQGAVTREPSSAIYMRSQSLPPFVGAVVPCTTTTLSSSRLSLPSPLTIPTVRLPSTVPSPNDTSSKTASSTQPTPPSCSSPPPCAPSPAPSSQATQIEPPSDARDRRDESRDNTKLMLPDAILREHRYGRVLSPCVRDSSTDASDDRQSGGQTDDSGSKDDGAAGMGGGLGLCIPGLVNRRSGDAANGEMRTPMAFLQWAPAELPPDDCKESTPKIKWKDPLIEVHEYPAEYDCYDRHDSLEKELFEQALRLDMIDGMPPTNSPRRISPRSYAEKDKEGYALRRNSSSSLSPTTPAKLPKDSTNTQEGGGQQADHGAADEADEEDTDSSEDSTDLSNIISTLSRTRNSIQQLDPLRRISLSAPRALHPVTPTLKRVSDGASGRGDETRRSKTPVMGFGAFVEDETSPTGRRSGAHEGDSSGENKRASYERGGSGVSSLESDSDKEGEDSSAAAAAGRKKDSSSPLARGGGIAYERGASGVSSLESDSDKEGEGPPPACSRERRGSGPISIESDDDK